MDDNIVGCRVLHRGSGRVGECEADVLRCTGINVVKAVAVVVVDASS